MCQTVGMMASPAAHGAAQSTTRSVALVYWDCFGHVMKTMSVFLHISPFVTSMSLVVFSSVSTKSSPFVTLSTLCWLPGFVHLYPYWWRYRGHTHISLSSTVLCPPGGVPKFQVAFSVCILGIDGVSTIYCW